MREAIVGPTPRSFSVDAAPAWIRCYAPRTSGARAPEPDIGQLALAWASRAGGRARGRTRGGGGLSSARSRTGSAPPAPHGGAASSAARHRAGSQQRPVSVGSADTACPLARRGDRSGAVDRPVRVAGVVRHARAVRRATRGPVRSGRGPRARRRSTVQARRRSRGGARRRSGGQGGRARAPRRSCRPRRPPPREPRG